MLSWVTSIYQSEYAIVLRPAYTFFYLTEANSYLRRFLDEQTTPFFNF